MSSNIKKPQTGNSFDRKSFERAEGKEKTHPTRTHRERGGRGREEMMKTSKINNSNTTAKEIDSNGKKKKNRKGEPSRVTCGESKECKERVAGSLQCDTSSHTHTHTHTERAQEKKREIERRANQDKNRR